MTMNPEHFKHIGTRVTNDVVRPLDEQCNNLKKKVEQLEEQLKRYLRFEQCHRYLTNGETPDGFFGFSGTRAMFVRQYQARPPKHEEYQQVPRLTEVDLIIIPEVLVPHKVRVSIPTSTPGVFTEISTEVAVPGITERMIKHSGNAKNVSVGTFAEVGREQCPTCKNQVLLVGIDELIDIENGDYNFTVNRFCDVCLNVKAVAAFSETCRDPYSSTRYYDSTRGIYQH